MGIGWNFTSCMDFMLLLYLEGSQMDRKSCVFHCIIPVRVIDNPFDPWNNFARRI